MYWLIALMLINGQLYIAHLSSFPEHEQCNVAMHEAEIAAQYEHQALICLRNAGLAERQAEPEPQQEEKPNEPSGQRVSQL